MVSADTSPNPVSWYTKGDRKTGSTAVTILFLKAPSTAMYFQNSDLLCQKFQFRALVMGVSHDIGVIVSVVRRHKRKYRMCLLLIGCNHQHELSVPASSEFQCHGRRTPTYQSMYID